MHLSEISEIVIDNVDGKSIPTTCKIHRPLKVFSLLKNNVSQIVFSNYGGGFVEGDAIQLNIQCLENTTSVFTSQANTRIYKSLTDATSKQCISGSSSDNSLTVFINDPVVPHAGSKFIQKVEWNLDPSAVLVYTDWLVAGRILNGERFNFDNYESSLIVHSSNKLVMAEKFKIEPKNLNVNSPGAFLNHNTYINLFLVGNMKLATIKKIEAILVSIALLQFKEDEPQYINDAQLLGTCGRINDNVFIMRCSAVHQESIQKLVKEFCASLAHSDLLGFNPGERKF